MKLAGLLGSQFGSNQDRHASSGWEFSSPSGGYVNRFTGEQRSTLGFGSDFLSSIVDPSLYTSFEWDQVGTLGWVDWDSPEYDIYAKPQYGWVPTSNMNGTADFSSSASNNGDLNWLGRQIQKYAGSDFSKQMFANFWTGGGDVKLSSARFQDVVQKAQLHGKSSLTTFNGQEALAQPARFYGTGYSTVFGDATIYYDLSGNPIGFEDTYDFNPYPIRWHSFFNAQLKTEMVDMASWFNFTDKPFKITYP